MTVGRARPATRGSHILVVLLMLAAAAGACDTAPSTPTRVPEPYTPELSVPLRVDLRVNDGLSSRQMMNFDEPPVVGYSMCGSITNRGPGTMTYTIEMEALGPDGRALPAREAPGGVGLTGTMAQGGARIGCGIASLLVEDLTRPWARTYRITIHARFEDGMAGNTWTENVLRELVTTVRPPRGVVISQIQTQGAGGPQDQFVELWNVSPSPVTLSGWSLGLVDWRNLPQPSWSIPSRVMGPGCYLLLANSHYSGSVTPDATPLQPWQFWGQLQADGGMGLHVGFEGTTDQVSMGYGPSYREGTPLPPLPPNQSYRRQGPDTDDNSKDFVAGPPMPRNSSSPCQP